MNSTWTRTLTFALWAALAVEAAAEPPQRLGAGLVGKLANCAEVPDVGARLSCYEGAAAALKSAVAAGDVMLVDRQQVRDVRRQAFGFSLPSISLFDREAPAEPVDRVEGRLAGAARDGAGRWTFRLEDGAVWSQVDSEALMRAPRPGMAVIIRKGLVGAYFLGLDGRAGVRVRRVQ